MRFFAAALFFCGAAASYAQAPVVPHKMHFAGMSLSIRDDARREIQKEVDALARPGRYYDMKVERARTYFPIIEKVFKEERLPEDFKFLALQESALVPDAVSTSNAVGFWQFKDLTAIQMGMRVDSEIDERMNIVSSSRGAAKYLKSNNFNFNNWILALQSYQMGAGGVINALGDQYNGDTHMEITPDTYWYVKRFLAHKIAFEDVVKGAPSSKIGLYETSDAKHIKDFAGILDVDVELLKEYNKWVRKGSIPGDRNYFLLVPNASTVLTDFNNLMLVSNKASKATPKKAAIVAMEERKEINGVRALLALQGESLKALADRADVSLSSFLKYNDISIDHKVQAGEFYFTGKKKKSASLPSIRTKMGEELWTISQRYGVRMKNLRKLNPDLPENLLAKGTFIRLSPSAQTETTIAFEEEPTEVAELSNNTFNWSLNPSVPDNTKAIEQKMEKTVSETRVVEVKTPDSDSRQVQNPVSEIKKDTVGNTKVAYRPENQKPPSEIYYEVKGSDTLYSVARQFGITIKELMDWNNKTNFNLVKGEKLKIIKK